MNWQKLTMAIMALALGLSSAVFANPVKVLSVDARTRQITIAYDSVSRWSPSDELCVFRGRAKVTCGTVTEASLSRVWIRVASRDQVHVGDWVTLRPSSRAPAAESSEDMIEKYNESPSNDISAGLTAGFNYFFPMVAYQRKIGDNFALGLMPMYVNFDTSGSTVKAWGGFLTASYYYTHFPFRGLSFEAGGGFYSIQSQVGNNLGSNYTQPAGMAQVQWRGRASWELGLDIGVGAGVQYLFQPSTPIAQNNFSGLLPMFTLSLGYSF